MPVGQKCRCERQRSRWGLTRPAALKEFVDRGTVKTVNPLENPVDLGYLPVHAPGALAKGGPDDRGPDLHAGHR